jgi:hypothetical protein
LRHYLFLSPQCGISADCPLRPPAPPFPLSLFCPRLGGPLCRKPIAANRTPGFVEGISPETASAWRTISARVSPCRAESPSSANWLQCVPNGRALRLDASMEAVLSLPKRQFQPMKEDIFLNIARSSVKFRKKY